MSHMTSLLVPIFLKLCSQCVLGELRQIGNIFSLERLPLVFVFIGNVSIDVIDLTLINKKRSWIRIKLACCQLHLSTLM